VVDGSGKELRSHGQTSPHAKNLYGYRLRTTGYKLSVTPPPPPLILLISCTGCGTGPLIS
jgi:hypothetical protein